MAEQEINLIKLTDLTLWLDKNEIKYSKILLIRNEIIKLT